MATMNNPIFVTILSEKCQLTYKDLHQVMVLQALFNLSR